MRTPSLPPTHAQNLFFSRDGIRGTEFVVLTETIKTDEIYETTVFEIVDIWQRRAVIPERKKTNVMNLKIAPAYCL